MFSEPRFVISRFRNVYDNRPRQQELDYGQLCGLLTRWQPPRENKTRTPCWSPARYPRGARRRKRDVQSVSLLVFDCDDGTPVEAAQAAFSGWSHIGHTSWSHTVEAPKWRLILPLAEPIPGPHWPSAFAAALRMWSTFMPAGSRPDRRCRDSSRLFFLPVWRADQDDRVAWAASGEALRLDFDPAEAAADPEPPQTWQLKPALRYRLRTDFNTRAALGYLMGGTIRSGLVTDIDCPGCTQPTARWAMDPARGIAAYCGELACGWSGPLDTLAAQLGERV